MDYYLSIDIGSTSGRHIVGWYEDGTLIQKEIYRFPNGADPKDGHYIWDLERIYREVKNGIRLAFQAYPAIRSLSIDTWGADYVLMNNDREIWPAYAYRDSRTELSAENVHKILPFSEIYSRIGYQFGYYNTIYQLYDDLCQGRLEKATDFLLIPEYLMYRLCGVKCKEATNCSTTSLVDPRTGKFDTYILEKLGLPLRLFPEICSPGTILGTLLPEVAEEVGGTCEVIVCATHDTESAISALPSDPDQIFVSSGTWSLLGVRITEAITTPVGEKAGFSNEGGLEYICYLTNIVGMWISERLRKELCPGESFKTIVEIARQTGYKEMIDPNAACFNTPKSMTQAIHDYIEKQGKTPPETMGEYFSCSYYSLAASYARSIRMLEEATGKTYSAICITGGGAKNSFLNSLTEQFTGKKVIPVDLEASSAGAIAVQHKTLSQKNI